MNDETGSVVVGVDVSKRQLDISAANRQWSVSNSISGIDEFVLQLKQMVVRMVVLESTGGLERPLMTALYSAGIPFSLINPGRVREFAKSIGQMAKTDKIDARLLVRYGEAINPPITRLPSEDEQLLSALLTRRRQLIDMLTQEKNRDDTCHPVAKESLERVMAMFDAEIASIDHQLSDLIKEVPEFREKNKLLQTVPGVGPILAMTLLADVPEIGTVDRKHIASLVGVAPFNKDSGHHHGKRSIKGGRAAVRSVLYMAALSAIRFNPIIRCFHDCLEAKGKPTKVVIVACMRKLLTILNAMIRSMSPFLPSLA